MLSASVLSGCATPRLHSVAELNEAGSACGLSLGEVVQEEEEKRLLFLFRVAPSDQQRRCIYQWARARHLKLVVIDAVEFREE